MNKFKEGIYLDFIKLRNNTPVKYSSIIKDKDVAIDDYLKNLSYKQEFKYYDKYGIRRTVSPQTISGFVINGQLYIYKGGSFNKVHFQGAICFFTAKVEIEKPSYNYSTDPFYSPVNAQQTDYYYELEQFFFKIETGTIKVATQENFSELIKDEPEIYNSYKMLPNKQRRSLFFMYLRKYNERHLIRNKQGNR